MQNKYRIIVVGDYETGKTSIIQRYTKNTFSYSTMGTITVDFYVKKIQVHGNDLNISIFDTSGHKLNRIYSRVFYRQVEAIIIVYDVRFRYTFDNLDYWFKDFTDYGNEVATITLVGNKIDLPDQRQVSYEEGLQKAQENNALFFETSARNDINIKEIFQKILEKTIGQNDKLIELDSLEIESTMKKNQKNKGQNCF